MEKKHPYTWEEAIQMLRKDPQHRDFLYYSYLTDDLLDNGRRYRESGEFKEILRVIRNNNPDANRVLDMPAGNGIASYAFAKEGFVVTALEPDPSGTVGRGAIEVMKQSERLTNISIESGYGESMPYGNESFDVVFVRQGLHHAASLPWMVGEIYRVLKREGIFIGAREHVVDDYNQSLKDFLDSQPDHQLYGGENAFTHEDYLKAIMKAGFRLLYDWGPYDSVVNLYPNDWDTLIQKYKKQNALFNLFLSNKRMVWLLKIPYQILLTLLKWTRKPGRLYTFIAKK